MAEKTDEQLSALMDGECDKPEMELALRRLAKDAGLKQRWQRYHLVGDTIRNYLPESIDADFSDRIMKMIDNEPPVRTTAASQWSSWYKPMAGFGLAASVALIAVFGLNLGSSDNSRTPSTEPKLAVVPDPAPGDPPDIAPREGIDSDDLESRLSNYLVNHYEYASMNGVQGVLPYVRIVGYQPNP